MPEMIKQDDISEALLRNFTHALDWYYGSSIDGRAIKSGAKFVAAVAALRLDYDLTMVKGNPRDCETLHARND